MRQNAAASLEDNYKMTKEEKAVEIFKQGYACAQAVAGAFCEELGLSLEKALEISCAFGAGFSLSRNTCGTLSAMGMVAGAVIGDHSPQAKKQVYACVKEMSRRFEEHFESTQCSVLLKNISRKSSLVPMERDEQYYKERPCVALIFYAARELEKWIAEYRAAQVER